jgi:hypothetical protein
MVASWEEQQDLGIGATDFMLIKKPESYMTTARFFNDCMIQFHKKMTKE